MADISSTAAEIVHFWFDTLEFKDWFGRCDGLDATISARYRDVHLALARGDFRQWMAAGEPCLAALLVLDQFSRNIYRGSPLAFACDGLGLALAEHAVEKGFDLAADPRRRLFFYLPFEHSERIEDQDRAVALIGTLNDPVTLDYAERHRAVIRTFGRFPHRNAILARVSTVEEQAYLAEPGAGF
nr:DUF924 family protein [uncultured Gellertiella sp.]